MVFQGRDSNLIDIKMNRKGFDDGKEYKRKRKEICIPH